MKTPKTIDVKGVLRDEVRRKIGVLEDDQYETMGQYLVAWNKAVEEVMLPSQKRNRSYREFPKCDQKPEN